MQEAAISGSVRGLFGARLSFRVSTCGRLLPVVEGRNRPKMMVEFIILELAGIDQALLISVVDVHSDN